MRIREAGPRRAPACSPLTTLVDRVTRSSTAVVLALCATYAFALPVLGLQDMAACNMFANLHGPTAVVTGMNHFLVPTGLLQALYEHSSPAEAGGELPPRPPGRGAWLTARTCSLPWLRASRKILWRKCCRRLRPLR